jgi:ADA HAT complex component 1
MTPTALFKASPHAPHLSSLMEQRGIGLDLQDIVGDAKTAVDLDAYSSEGESEDETTDTNVEVSQDRSQLSVRGGRQPARTTMPQTGPQRSDARKGLEKAGSKPHQLRAATPTGSTIYTSPCDHSAPATSSRVDGSGDADIGMDSSENLSPHTVESNQAPSLVSDDDEYEAPSESESPSPSSEAESDRDFDHVEVEDDEGAATSTTTTDTKTDPELTSPAKHHTGSLSKSLRRRSERNKGRSVTTPPAPLTRGKSERRVSFASPNPPTTRAKDTGRRHRS